MSTKTLRKRVALVAASAVSLGLLTGVSPAFAGTGAATYSANTSTLGLVSPAANITGGTDGTAVLLKTGSLKLTIAAGTATGAATDANKVVVSAGGYISAATNETIASDQLSAVGSIYGLAGDVTIKTTGAVGSTFTVTTYPNSASGTAASSVLTVTIADTSVAGTVSTAKSYVVWSAYADPAAVGTVDSSTANETTTGLKLTGHIQLADSYGNAITSTTGALVVTASSGAVVGISSGSGDPSVGTYSTAVSSADPSDINFEVGEATAGAGWSGTVTVTYNGVVIATKSGKITGSVAKLTIESVKIGKNNGAASADALRYEAKDAAGNTLPLAAAKVVYSLSSNTAVVATAVGTTASTSDTRGYGSITCSSSATGSVDLTMQTTLDNGTVIKSNTVKALCGGAADTYSASLDKAKYAQGDVATLKVTFKDIKGALANSYDSVTNLAAANASISFPMAKQIGAISQADVTDVNGQVSYKFNIGDVSSFAAGKYNAVVSFGTPANGAAQTVAYEVSGAGGVSNSDILSSIVKLITAINKQIAALQKLLLKK